MSGPRFEWTPAVTVLDLHTHAAVGRQPVVAAAAVSSIGADPLPSSPGGYAAGCWEQNGRAVTGWARIRSGVGAEPGDPGVVALHVPTPGVIRPAPMGFGWIMDGSTKKQTLAMASWDPIFSEDLAVLFIGGGFDDSSAIFTTGNPFEVWPVPGSILNLTFGYEARNDLA